MLDRETSSVSSTSPAGSAVLIVFPGLAWRDGERDRWNLRLQGVVYEPGEVALRRKVLTRLIQRAADVDANETRGEIFRQRMQAFVAPTRRGHAIRLESTATGPLVEVVTNGSGHFHAAATIGAVELTAAETDCGRSPGCLPIHAALSDQLVADGQVQLVQPTGLSIISDIDDTIKQTEVTNRRELFRNTFLRAFRPIEGMAAVYREWADRGAVFHYVSASPWQLYRPLAELLDRHSFPPGSFHLRPFRVRSAALRRVLVLRRPGKYARIKSLVASFPRRRFVLVGDSGDRDLEIYGRLARCFPTQIAHIFIRQLAVAPVTSARSSRAFRQLPPDLWRVFRDAAELRDIAWPVH